MNRSTCDDSSDHDRAAASSESSVGSEGSDIRGGPGFEGVLHNRTAHRAVARPFEPAFWRFPCQCLCFTVRLVVFRPDFSLLSSCVNLLSPVTPPEWPPRSSTATSAK